MWFSLWSDAGVPPQRYSTLRHKRSRRSIKLIFVLTIIGAIIYLGFIYVDVSDKEAGFGTPPAARAFSAKRTQREKLVAKRKTTPIERHPLPRGRTYVQYAGWDNGFPFRPSR